jgi:hypothetical protein
MRMAPRQCTAFVCVLMRVPMRVAMRVIVGMIVAVM